MGNLTVNVYPLRLLPGYVYRHEGGDPVTVAEDQGTYGVTNEQVLKQGDSVESPHPLYATCVGTAELSQAVPGTEPKPKAKAKSKKG